MAWIPYAVMAIGAVSQASNTIAQGELAKQESRQVARQMDMQANDEQAAGQRQAIEARRRSRLKQSRAQAVAAASGAGVSDPTVSDLIADIEVEGEYGALTALYEGDTRANDLRYGAENTRRGGKNAVKAARTSANSTILSSAGSMYSKYGGMPSSGYGGYQAQDYSGQTSDYLNRMKIGSDFTY